MDDFKRLRLSEYAAAGILDLLQKSGAACRYVSYNPIFGSCKGGFVHIFQETYVWLQSEDIIRISDDCSPAMFYGVMTAKGFRLTNQVVEFDGRAIRLGALISDHETTLHRIRQGEHGRRRYHWLLGLLSE